jgi:hypothetical protein
VRSHFALASLTTIALLVASCDALSQQSLLGYVDLNSPEMKSAEITSDELSALLKAAAGQPPDLTGKRLSGLDLTGFDLSGANLRLARLNHTKLNGAKLSGANLNQACLLGLAGCVTRHFAIQASSKPRSPAKVAAVRRRKRLQAEQFADPGRGHTHRTHWRYQEQGCHMTIPVLAAPVRLSC